MHHATHHFARLERGWERGYPDVRAEQMPRLQGVDVRAVVQIELANKRLFVLLSGIFSPIAAPCLQRAKTAEFTGRRFGVVVVKAMVLTEEGDQGALRNRHRS